MPEPGQPRAVITGTGSSMPEKILTNKDLEKMVDTTDEWITTRTGIKERRITGENQASSDLASEAGRLACENAGIAAADLDQIIVATCTPDHLFPSTSCLVQKKLGAKNATCFDVSAACSGFIFGLMCANSAIKSGLARNILVIGVDTLSKFADWKDRNTCVLFGDGAGAAVVSSGGKGDGILSIVTGCDGEQSDILIIPGGGSRHPVQPDGKGFQEFPPYIRMEGKEVFKHAVTRMLEVSAKALAAAGKKPEDLALLIPHQANLRIIQAMGERLKLPEEKLFVNVQQYGNMSSATTIIALDQAQRCGRLKRGGLVELVAFGAGLTWGAAVLEW